MERALAFRKSDHLQNHGCPYHFPAPLPMMKPLPSSLVSMPMWIKQSPRVSVSRQNAWLVLIFTIVPNQEVYSVGSPPRKSPTALYWRTLRRAPCSQGRPHRYRRDQSRHRAALGGLWLRGQVAVIAAGALSADAACDGPRAIPFISSPMDSALAPVHGMQVAMFSIVICMFSK